MTDEDRIPAAIARIEKALARIETQSALLGGMPAQDSQLEEKHAALRDSVSATLSELDGLIDRLDS